MSQQRIEPETPMSFPVAQNLLEIERIDSAVGKALEIASSTDELELRVKNLERQATSMSTMASLGMARGKLGEINDLVVDALRHLRNASTLARRDSLRPPYAKPDVR